MPPAHAASPATTADLLRSVRAVVPVDGPWRDVPESLTGAGCPVVGTVGPAPSDRATSTADEALVSGRRTGAPPSRAEPGDVRRRVEAATGGDRRG